MRLRILLIEDVKSTREAYRRVLELEGLEIHEAKNFGEAERALRSIAFHVVCIDLGLDESDPSNLEGTRVLQELAKYHEGTKAIIVSQKGGERAHDIAIDAYENFKLAKWLRKGHFSVEEFVAVIKDEASRVRLPISHASTSVLEALVFGLDEDLWIDEALRALNPRGGVVGLRDLLDALAKDLIPICPHKDPHLRALIGPDRKFVQFQFWSRAIGSAILVRVIAKDGGMDAEAATALKEISLAGLTAYAWRYDEGAPDDYG